MIDQRWFIFDNSKMNIKADKENLLPPLWVLTLLVVGLGVWVVIKLQAILVMLLLAFAVAYVIEPVLKLFEKIGIRRPVAFFTICSIAFLTIWFIVISVLPVFTREYQVLSEKIPAYLHDAKESYQPYLDKYGILDKSTLETLDVAQLAKDFMPKVLAGLKETLLKGYSFTATLLNIFLLPFLVYYLSISFVSIYPTFVKIFPDKMRSKVTEITGEINTYLAGFVRGQIAVSFIMFILYMIGLKIVGVELWFILAAISGFGNLIPYVGTITGITLSSIMALINFGDWTHLVAVWAVFAVVQFAEGVLITPKIIGDKIGFSPLMVILALFAGGTLFGLLGVLLAIPFAAVCKVLFTHFHKWLLKRS